MDMARKPFKLKSGNKTPFKMMGSSPIKEYVSDAQRKAVWASKKDGGKGNPNKMTNNSPVKVVSTLLKGVKLAKKLFTKTKKPTISPPPKDPMGDFIRKSLKNQLSSPVGPIKNPYVTKHPQTGKEVVQKYGRKSQITIK